MVALTRNTLVSHVLMAVLAVLLLARATRAEEIVVDLEEEAILGEKTESNAVPNGVVALGRLTDNPFRMVPNGRDNDITIDFFNVLNTTAKIVSARGFLLTPKADDANLTLVEDFRSRTIVRNMSNYVYNREIQPLSNITLHYKFAVDIAPRSYGFGVIVDTEYTLPGKDDADGNPMVDTTSQTILAFLEDVTVVDQTSLFDFESLGIYLMFAAVAAGFYYLNYLSPEAKKANARAKSYKKADTVEHVAPKTAADVKEEWIPDHIVQQQKKAKSRASKKN